MDYIQADIDKLNSLTFRTAGCWYFSERTKDGRAYRMKLASDPKGTPVHVRRMAWEVAHNEPVPEGMIVRASCMELACINPDHLELGLKGWQ